MECNDLMAPRWKSAKRFWIKKKLHEINDDDSIKHEARSASPAAGRWREREERDPAETPRRAAQPPFLHAAGTTARQIRLIAEITQRHTQLSYRRRCVVWGFTVRGSRPSPHLADAVAQTNDPILRAWNISMARYSLHVLALRALSNERPALRCVGKGR